MYSLLYVNCTSIRLLTKFKETHSYLYGSVDFQQRWKDNSVKKEVFSTNSMGTIGDTPVHKNYLDPYFTPNTQINSKWIIDLNGKPKTINLLGENRKSLCPLVRQGFLRYNMRRTIHEGKINKLEFIKIKNFCSLRDIVKKMKT